MDSDERRRRDRESHRGGYGRLTEQQKRQRYEQEQVRVLALRAEESPQETEARRAKYRASAKRDRERDRETYNAKRRAYNAERTVVVKAQLFKALGGACSTCGITDWRVLQVDHIDGGGSAHRKRSGGWHYWHSMLKDLTKYQLLCANCHMIKSWPRGREAIATGHLEQASISVP